MRTCPLTGVPVLSLLQESLKDLNSLLELKFKRNHDFYTFLKFFIFGLDRTLTAVL